MPLKKQPLKVLIIAAYGREMQYLQGKKQPLSEESPLYQIVKGKAYQKIVNDVGFLAAGIGPVAASFGLTHFLEKYKPEKIISIGTAGIINDDRFKIGDVAYVSSVHQDSQGADAYLVSKVKQIKVANEAFAEFVKDNDLQALRVYAGQEITKSKERAAVLKSHYDAEHMESYAFAYVAQKFRIPYLGLLGFTNFVGPNAHEDWKQNEDAVCKRLGCLCHHLI